ncbi:MAG: molybdopterin molybdenumtransferase MoeA [Alphaproteobacteria bacterium]|nr:molybdopterin molybdenumtransferase MoeA [Alphaproteobacteria bacterium]
MLSVAEASKKVVANLKPLASEQIPLVSALGCILASNVKAKRTQPPLDVSAMDGYAVRSNDVAKLPAKLKIVGSIAAGQVFAGSVRSGEAARIFTGAPIPRGADTVVIQENTKSDGTTVEVVDGQAPAGKHIRRAGLDFREGDILLRTGHRLTGRDIALAAAMNHTRLDVRRRPRVAILATGDELVPPGTIPGPGQIVGSSAAGLSADVIAWGGTVRDLGIAHDEVTDIRFKSEAAQTANLFVTLGGASVGDHDLIQKALADDLDVAFWKIAMRPGKPLIFGRYKSVPFLGLPGNPVSAMVCAHIFLKPMIYALQGYDGPAHETRQARLTRALPANDERQDYVRAVFRSTPEGQGDVEPFPVQDSSMMRTMSAANCLIVRPPGDPARAQGATVNVMLLD